MSDDDDSNRDTLPPDPLDSERMQAALTWPPDPPAWFLGGLRAFAEMAGQVIDEKLKPVVDRVRALEENERATQRRIRRIERKLGIE